MMKTLCLTLALLLAHPLLAGADSETAGGGPPTARNTGRHGMRKSADAQHTRRGPGKIVGHCTVVASQDNPIDSPCANLVLILSDSKNTDVNDVRTTSRGEFEFSFDKDSQPPFKIRSGSKFYDVVSPADPIPGNVQVELKLKQK